MFTNERRDIELLIKHRYHNAGHVGFIEEVFSEDEASVDLNYYQEDKPNIHRIHIRSQDEGIVWKFHNPQ